MLSAPEEYDQDESETIQFIVTRGDDEKNQISVSHLQSPSESLGTWVRRELQQARIQPNSLTTEQRTELAKIGQQRERGQTTLWIAGFAGLIGVELLLGQFGYWIAMLIGLVLAIFGTKFFIVGRQLRQSAEAEIKNYLLSVQASSDPHSPIDPPFGSSQSKDR